MAQTYSARTQQGYAPLADAYSTGSQTGQYPSYDQYGNGHINDPQPHVHAQEHASYGYEQPFPAPEPAYTYDASGRGYATDGTPLRPKLGAAQWGGAIVSLALIFGLGIWGYNLMARDVSGVPVIRDMSGSARLVPENPGGQLAMHQGLSVNSVTADGSAGAPADTLTLAPRPMALTDEDRPMGETVTIVSNYQPDNAYTQPAEPLPVLAPLSAEVVVPDPLELSNVEPVAADAGVELPLETGALTRSPVPKARPVRLAAVAATDVTASAAISDANLNDVAGDILAALSSENEMPTSQVAVGTPLVQFGAFQNEDIARAEWDRLVSKFDALMKDKTRIIEEAESGGRTFYRLRALGFADAADSNRFCAALTASNAACVPARQR
ncbi:SPOR domain-containing protein [Pacificibacter marinus]|uniref:SPOR domain-containing protein n=1 Tax=Pacificibacter marinus TaxID=658057 RepID=UPI001C071823|nr:SPOR domain-containing protein [Pacificibacter marinus]MBU2865437.1 SPOR domain-containing protein [Pacificibacter marinus]